MKIGYDVNGNRIVKLSSSELDGATGFSIQTLQNLPRTHSNGIGDYTLSEVVDYVMAYGTGRQKEAIAHLK